VHNLGLGGGGASGVQPGAGRVRAALDPAERGFGRWSSRLLARHLKIATVSRAWREHRVSHGRLRRSTSSPLIRGRERGGRLRVAGAHPDVGQADVYLELLCHQAIEVLEKRGQE